MRQLAEILLEKLKINKDIKINSHLSDAYNIVKDMLDEGELKYELMILELKRQSLYNPSDYADDNYIHFELIKNINMSEFQKFCGYISRELRINKIKIELYNGKYTIKNGKSINQWCDILIKK